METVLNQVLEAQVTDHLGAQRYERSVAREAYRTGYRLRMLTTRVGPLVRHVLLVRDGSLSTALFDRYQRSEETLVLALMEMVRNGVSTRKVPAITEGWCGTRFSRSTASPWCTTLAARVQAWHERPLGARPT